MKKLNLIAAGIFLFAACTPKTAEVIAPVEKPATVVTSEFPSTEIAEGSKLYAENCGKCHGLKTVTNFTPEQWHKIVPKMSTLAKIDATQENKILEYVLWKSQK
jgi:mono/diheme cytochrome c family protein